MQDSLWNLMIRYECPAYLWRRLLSYRNQSIDLQSKSKDWFLYDDGLRHERARVSIANGVTTEVLIFAFASSMKTHTQPLFTCLKSIMKHQNNVRNMFRVNNKNPKKTSLTFILLVVINLPEFQTQKWKLLWTMHPTQ